MPLQETLRQEKSQCLHNNRMVSVEPRRQLGILPTDIPSSLAVELSLTTISSLSSCSSSLILRSASSGGTCSDSYVNKQTTTSSTKE